MSDVFYSLHKTFYKSSVAQRVVPYEWPLAIPIFHARAAVPRVPLAIKYLSEEVIGGVWDI